ncbi:MAG: hydrogenase maturation nickel metallochaperone HypA [Pelolinea sp.]|nr:hydrogenase maturation nickel metallochaperone HypA [Pelolinea sp.]
MHELSITESLLNTASDYAQKNKAKRVTALNLVIGELSGIIDDSVQFYWDMISENSICEKSVLNFDKRKAVMKCMSCDNEFSLGGELSPCPSCSSMDLKFISGNEFLLESIEIEK